MNPEDRRRSRWFPVSQTPDLPGLYEFRISGFKSHGKRFWTGGHWRFLNGQRDWTESGDQWRGLAEKPE